MGLDRLEQRNEESNAHHLSVYTNNKVPGNKWGTIIPLPSCSDWFVWFAFLLVHSFIGVSDMHFSTLSYVHDGCLSF